MSLSSSTLAAIQKVGVAAFIADEKLKKEVQAYGERVNAAITKNAYNLGNDALIENWKVVARLSQTLVGIEIELKKVFQVASELTIEDQPSVREVPVLAAPTRSSAKGVRKPIDITPATVKGNANKKTAKPASPAVAATQGAVKHNVASPTDLTPTDVLAKPKKKAVLRKSPPAVAATDVALKPKKKAAAPKAKANKPKAAGAAEKTLALSANPAKLMQHLERVLNSNDFIEISQTVVAQETGIPLGSMTAAIKKLAETGRITAGPNGSLKLATTQPEIELLSQSPVQA